MSRPWPNVIALALSGGGYRAAAFHLGVLRALDDVGALARVRQLSTASGGTILGASWLVGRKRGEVFHDFERRMRTTMDEKNVVLLAAKRMAGMAHPSLSRAAADVYDEIFLGGAHVPLGHISDVVDEVRFNATEMDTGNSFRFALGNAEAKIGNQRRSLDAATRDRVRVADVVAASACFPGAFEPLVFPDDFHGDDLTLHSDAPPEKGHASVGLMDGGIYDNQALDPLLLLDRQTTVSHKADLVIACDVDNGAEPIFAARPAPLPGLLALPLRLRTVVLALDLVAAAVVVLVITGAVGAALDSSWARAVLLGAASLSLALGAAWIGARFAVTSFVTNLLPFAWTDWDLALGALPVGGVVRLIERRLGSLVALTARVFMKRVRALGYGDAERELRVAASTPAPSSSSSSSSSSSGGPRIRTALLLRKNAHAAGTDRLVATPAMLTVRAAAAKQATQLWFADGRDLDRVVLAGRMAALEALDAHLDDDDARVTEAWRALAADCAA